MKICITSQKNNLDSIVEQRFGRSPYFIIWDTETSDFEAIENPNVGAASGVGIQSGQLMSDKGVKVILTGQIGPKAMQTLTSAGIEVITDVSGTVKEAIEKYQSGSFKVSEAEAISAKSPVVGSFGQGKGRGLGTRGGQGRGRMGFAGPGGYCICPNCGEKVVHQAGVPCRAMVCPKCDCRMIRE